ncbi:MAG TPA: GntR family transcriptional regulator [Spirochaetales bacterium]|nr:GntR family transcriptional regulator [Spirochaetales bacterium]
MIETVAQITKKNYVYESLKAKIIKNELKPLEYLNEKDLALEMGTSKTPIREALQELKRNRFVMIIPTKGCFVANVSLEDIREIYELREIYECNAVRIAAGKPDKDKKILADQLREYEVTALNDSMSAQGRLLAGYQIHSAIVHSVGNSRLDEAYKTLQDHIVRIRIYVMNRYIHTRVKESEEEHRAIIQAILMGDPQKAEEAMRLHLQNALFFIKHTL